MFGFLKKFVQATSPFGKLDFGGQKILGIDNSSLFNPAGTEAEKAARAAAQKARDAAAAQEAATQAAAEQNKLELANMQANSVALSNANADTTQGAVANVVAGGYADAVDTTKKRRVQAQTLASTLGINL